ncbi:hypothetical protein C4J65_26385 [Streptomyces sp. CB09001]|nr:hypothetical protein C4J65_26385 [Streptomyces sp. CB09001]
MLCRTWSWAVFSGMAPAEAATATVYQCTVATFNGRPGEVFCARGLCDHFHPPTEAPSIDVTHSRSGRPVRQGHLEQLGHGHYQKRTQRGGNRARGVDGLRERRADLHGSFVGVAAWGSGGGSITARGVRPAWHSSLGQPVGTPQALVRRW